MVHPSHFHLDCYHTGTLAADEQEQVGHHAAECEECQRYLGELDAEQRALENRLPAAALLDRLHKQQPTRRKPAARWLRWPLVPAAVAAGILSVVIVTSMMGPSYETLRPRGKAAVTVYSPRGAVPTGDGPAKVERGEALRFQVNAPGSGYLTLFFVDSAGEVTWFAPEGPGDTPVPIRAGQTILPGSAILDEASSGDRVFLVFRRELFDPREIAQRVVAARRAHHETPLESDSWIPEEDGLWTITLVQK